jgi:hypothetical protein
MNGFAAVLLSAATYRQRGEDFSLGDVCRRPILPATRESQALRTILVGRLVCPLPSAYTPLGI